MAQQQWEGWIQTNETLLMAILLVVSLAVIIALVSPDTLGLSGTTVEISPEGEAVAVIASERPASNVSECMAAYGASETDVVYVYSDDCTFSQQNTPWVLEMKNGGNGIYMASTDNAKAMGMIASCLASFAVLEGTPEYICPKTKRVRIGAFDSREELESFVSECE